MAAGLGALGHQNIDARCDLPQRMLLGTDERRDRDIMLSSHVDHLLRRHAESVRDQLDRMAKGDVEHVKRALRIERLRLVVGDVGRRQFDAVFLQQVAGEVAMLRRDPRLQAFPGDVLFARG